MRLISSDRLQKNCDVIVVGSGAGGGQTACTRTMEGVQDLRCVGNVALAAYDGPPPEVLRKAGLA